MYVWYRGYRITDVSKDFVAAAKRGIDEFLDRMWATWRPKEY